MSDDLEITVEEPKPDDTALEVVEAKTPDPVAAPIIEADEGLEQLKAKLLEAQAAAERERASRLEAERRAASAQGEVQDTNVQLVANAIEAHKQSVEVAKGRFAEALAAQDYTAASDAQVEIATLAADLRQLEGGLRHLKEAPKREAPLADPVENLARQLEPRSAQWVRTHPDYARDPAKYQMMMGAHNVAMAKGIAPDSDAYFQDVETTLGLRSQASAGDPMSEAGKRTPAAAPPAAPVTRGANGGGSDSPNRVTLTAEEREIAQMSFPDLPAQDAYRSYAREKLKLQKALN